MLRGLFGRRRAPAVRARAAAPVAPARPLGASAPRLLTAASFTAGRPLVGNLSRLASYEVPRGEVFELDAARPFRLLIKSQLAVSVAADEDGSALIDLHALGVDLVESTRPAAALPSTRNPNVVVYHGDTRVMIEEIDYDGNTVLVSGLPVSAAADLVVFALAGNGEIKIRAVQPAGSDVNSVELFNDTFKALHETNQADGETAPRFRRGEASRYPLAPKWLLSIEVKSDLLLSWDARAENVFDVAGYRLPVSVTDAGALNRAVAARLG